MDKNTITGLVLIAILLVGFSFLSRPNKEQLAAQQRYYDSIAQVQQREADLKLKLKLLWLITKRLKQPTLPPFSLMRFKEPIHRLQYKITLQS